MTQLLSYKTERGIENALTLLRRAHPSREFIRIILPDFTFGAGLVDKEGRVVARVLKGKIAREAGIR